MTFKPHELDFLRQADLGRLATIQPDGSPQNSPVGFTYNESLGTIDIAGYRMSKSQKFRNIARNDKVAFVVDDITSRDPWRVRCLEIRGTADRPRSRRRTERPVTSWTPRSSGSRRAASSASASTIRSASRIS
jgi:PPOX class F420-dependent enzyme/OxyR family protein